MFEQMNDEFPVWHNVVISFDCRELRFRGSNLRGFGGFQGSDDFSSSPSALRRFPKGNLSKKWHNTVTGLHVCVVKMDVDFYCTVFIALMILTPLYNNLFIPHLAWENPEFIIMWFLPLWYKCLQ